MKNNPTIKQIATIMLGQEIPQDKVREYSAHLSGFCNSFSGITRVIEEAVNYVKETNLTGQAATDYIGKQIASWGEHLNKSMLENALNWP